MASAAFEWAAAALGLGRQNKLRSSKLVIWFWFLTSEPTLSQMLRFFCPVPFVTAVSGCGKGTDRKAA